MKQLEVELKILDINLPQLIVSLEREWAIRQSEKTIFDIYYDMKEWSSLKSNNKGMRVRHMWGEKIMTLKTRVNKANISVKQAIEEEYTIWEWCEKKMLKQRGLIPSWMKYKKRLTYTYWTMHFDIDMYPGIPPVLEIEAETEGEIILRVKKLWLEKKDQSISWTRGLFKRYGKKPLAVIH